MLTREALAEQVTAAIERFRRALPHAGCLIVGAPDQARRDRQRDWQTPESLGWIIAVQRRVALRMRCAFWDQRRAMGGVRSIFRWLEADPPLARTDHVHFNQAGYERLAEALYKDLIGG